MLFLNLFFFLFFLYYGNTVFFIHNCFFLSFFLFPVESTFPESAIMIADLGSAASETSHVPEDGMSRLAVFSFYPKIDHTETVVQF